MVPSILQHRGSSAPEIASTMAVGWAKAVSSAFSPKAVELLAFRRDEGAVHTFLLEAQHSITTIETSRSPPNVARRPRPPMAAPADQRGRADKAHPVFHLSASRKIFNRATRLCANAYPRQDGDVPGGGIPPLARLIPHPAHSRQRLRRVFVPPVARVQNGAVHLVGQQFHCAGMRVAQRPAVRR